MSNTCWIHVPDAQIDHNTFASNIPTNFLKVWTCRASLLLETRVPRQHCLAQIRSPKWNTKSPINYWNKFWLTWNRWILFASITRITKQQSRIGSFKMIFDKTHSSLLLHDDINILQKEADKSAGRKKSVNKLDLFIVEDAWSKTNASSLYWRNHPQTMKHFWGFWRLCRITKGKMGLRRVFSHYLSLHKLGYCFCQKVEWPHQRVPSSGIFVMSNHVVNPRPLQRNYYLYVAY